MLLAVDIGNTNIKMALFKGERAFSVRRLVTDKKYSANQYARKLKRLFKSAQVKDTEAIVICSVVPKLTPVLKKALFLVFNKKPLILGRDIIAPIKNLYRKPKQVGQDRLVNALAAVNKYGAPVIVVDFGTALTFDLVSAKGGYLGGIIVPGMELSLQALINKAELLPEIALSKPHTLLGRETVSSMKSGIVYGYGFLVEGILQQLKKRLKTKCQVVATGGEASLMRHYAKSINKIDENLTLEGLKVAFQGRKQMRTGKNR
jgi:type III pantothenate kinase